MMYEFSLLDLIMGLVMWAVLTVLVGFICYSIGGDAAHRKGWRDAAVSLVSKDERLKRWAEINYENERKKGDRNGQK